MVDIPIRTSINTHGQGGVVVTNDVVGRPPCVVWVPPSLSVDTNCLLNSLNPLSVTDFEHDGWPSVLPRPNGISLDYLAQVFDQYTTGTVRDSALEDIHKIGRAYSGGGGFRLSDLTSTKRVLSCDLNRDVVHSGQAVYATLGQDSKLLQPSSVGCATIPQFCPLFAGINSVVYRFWTYYPGPLPDITVPGSKIRLDMWPGFSNNDNQSPASVTTFRKSMCNMDSSGATCFYLTSAQLAQVGINGGYGTLQATIWPLNVRARWTPFGDNWVTSDWQTWLVLNMQPPIIPRLQECLTLPI